ncbi:MAG: efflux RND transporter periplasmic adaptor subunit [Gammaproteobacteria bacterium]|nr:efflux RND transporter periplasmic adaptor subunit [Gammaproteobacteria bacterium]
MELKKNVLVSLIFLVILIWTIEKIWPLVIGKLFSHAPLNYVETIILKPQAGKQTWQAVGTVKAMHNITIESEVTGIVETLNVSNNQKVNQGDIILSLKHDDITANLQKNQAILTQKQLYYQRLKRLDKSISEESLSVALSEFQQAEAAVTADLAALNKYIIKAPFSGVLGIWQIDIGQLVKPGDHLISLSELSPAFIDFMLPAKALSNILIGDDIQFTTPTFPDRTWHGIIIAIDPQLDNATRNIILRAKIVNEDNKLVPNLYGQILVIKKTPAQFLIPQEAVIYDPQGTSVYIIRDKKAQLQPVKLGLHQENEVVIEKGLQTNDEVVTAGMMKLFPGSSVIVNKQVIQQTISSDSAS